MSSKLLNTCWEHHPLLSTGIQVLRSRPVRVFILAVVVALSIVWLLDIARLSSIHEQYPPVPRERFYHWNTKPVVTPYSEVNAGTPCKRFPANVFETVQVVLKTGMTEEPQRLLTHLKSVTKCIPNLLIVSDHDDVVNDHKIYDVLAKLPASYGEGNPDFQTYHTQKALKDSDNITQYNTEAGWKLDRFKFLPMVYTAYNMSPKAQWFVFIETDTYVFWDNLFRLLSQFDSSVPLYMGSPLHGDNHGEDYIYAYGGSGIVLSRAATHALLERKTDKNGAYIEDELCEQEYWVGMLKNSTYGESILGYALQKKAGVKLSGFYPMFHPMNPESLKFSEENLCTPIISLHKLRSEKYEVLWNWEMGPGNTQVGLGDLRLQSIIIETNVNPAYSLLEPSRIPPPAQKPHPERLAQLVSRSVNQRKCPH